MQKPELTRSVVEGSWSEAYRNIDLKPVVPTCMSEQAQMVKEDHDAPESTNKILADVENLPFPTKVLKRENTNGICKRCSDFTCIECSWV